MHSRPNTSHSGNSIAQSFTVSQPALALKFLSYFCDRDCNKNRIGKPGKCYDGDCNREGVGWGWEVIFPYSYTLKITVVLLE